MKKQQAQLDCYTASVPLQMQNLLNLEKNNDSEAKNEVETLDSQLWHCFKADFVLRIHNQNMYILKTHFQVF